MPLTNAAKELCRFAMREGRASQDFSALYDCLTNNCDFATIDEQPPAPAMAQLHQANRNIRFFEDGARRTLVSKVKRVLILVMAAGTVTLIVGCERSVKRAKSKVAPEAEPLAQPKSLQQVGVPVEMTRATIPPDNPQTPEKISLGQKLFFDRRLSVDGTVSCSTCHDPERAFTDRKATSVGIKGRVGQRNAPTVLNALYNKTQFWDGRVNTLEEQAALPIVNSVEMGHPNPDAAGCTDRSGWRVSASLPCRLWPPAQWPRPGARHRVLRTHRIVV